MSKSLTVLSLIATILCAPTTASAQLRAVPFVGGLNVPVEFVQDPSNPGIQYVVEQGGLIRIIQNGVLLAMPFIDLSGLVAAGGERGLLGMALPPNYATSGRFYVYYTRNGTPSDLGDIVVARYKRSTGNPLLGDPATRKDLVWGGVLPYIEHSSAGNHNGGHIAFGPDGYLYIATGDGGNTPQRAQDPGSLLGKILRVDVNVPDGNGQGYAVPPDNPFVDSLPIVALTEIWAFGLRNPWKFSFDDVQGGTNALIIADVGQAAWEEVDYEPANRGGRNYGWLNREGAHDYFNVDPPAYPPLTNPTFEYDHSIGSSITGGYFYRGSEMRSVFAGRYFYADFVRGRVWSLGLAVNAMSGEATASNVIEHTDELGGSDELGAISSFGRDASGEIYIVSYAGTIFKIVDATPPPNNQVVLFNDNGDAYKDLLLYNRDAGTWTVHHGNAIGQFTLNRAGGWAPGWQIYLASFNLDGLDDLFLYNAATGVWFKVINTGNGFSYFTQGWLPGFTVYIVDLNADGRSDVFIHNPVTGMWFTCVSVGNGTTGFTYASGGWQPGLRVLPADFDGDNQSDFLLYDPVTGLFYKAITRGNGMFIYTGGGWAPGWLTLIAELNGDSHDDVFLYNSISGDWYRATSSGDGTGPFAYVMGGWAAGWTVQTADFDNNGRTDFFLYHSNGTWYKVINNGIGFSYFTGGWGLWTTTVTDLNGDGNSDLFLYNPGTGVWYQALTTTPGAFTYATGRFPR